MAFKHKDAENKYNNDYKSERYDRITLLVTKGKKEIYQQAAQDEGISLSAFAVRCIEEKINKK
mgnify:CR=1 FL=1